MDTDLVVRAQRGDREAYAILASGIADSVSGGGAPDLCRSMQPSGARAADRPSVDDLVTALTNLAGFEASAPIDLTVDGHPATRFTHIAPQSSPCGLNTWITPERTTGVGLLEENVLVVVDVEGNRFMMEAAYDPRLVTDSERQAIEDIISCVLIDE